MMIFLTIAALILLTRHLASMTPRDQPYRRALIYAPPSIALILYGLLAHPFLPSHFHHQARDAQIEQWQLPADLLPRIDQLAARLKDNPHDVIGWRMLGQSYHLSGQYNRARLTYARARQLYPDDLALLALQSELLLQLRDGSSYEVFQQLLARTNDKEELMALISRTMALGAPRETRDAIKKLQTLYPEGSRTRDFLDDSLEQLSSP